MALPRPLFSLLLLTAALAARPGWAQDVYFSQPFATRLHTNPAFTGLFDDYSVTLSYRNQFTQLPGAFQSYQLAADLRPDKPGQHHAFGALINQDRSGEVGYGRFELGGLYAYHTRLSRGLALSGGASLSYGRQRVGDNNYLFGDQFADDGSLRGPSAESLNFPPVNYFSVGTGVVLYSDRAWLSLAGQQLNQPDLGFRQQSSLPARLNVNGGYKIFIVSPTTGQGKAEVREISLTGVGSYTRQGGSSRPEAGAYLTIDPLTLGVLYRNILAAGDVGTQQALALVVGLSAGPLRLGYSYDVGLGSLSTQLGGAHELTLSLRSFDKLDNAQRRLKRRAYPLAPCPAF